MKKIVLLCNMGLSTSALVTKMKNYAKEKGYDYDIEAFPFMEAESVGVEADCILIGPQIRFNLEKVKKMFPTIPSSDIEMIAYGTLDGGKVIEYARKLMNE